MTLKLATSLSKNSDLAALPKPNLLNPKISDSKCDAFPKIVLAIINGAGSGYTIGLDNPCRCGCLRTCLLHKVTDVRHSSDTRNLFNLFFAHGESILSIPHTLRKLITPYRYTVGTPSIGTKIANTIRYRSDVRALVNSPALDDTQLEILNNLRKDGYAILPNYISESMLCLLKKDYQQSLDELRFLSTPILDYSKLEPLKDESLSRHVMGLNPGELAKTEFAIDKNNCRSYQQVITDFSPSELATHMFEYSENFLSVWLDPYILSIVCQYLGLVPQLVESYVRRSFPAPYRILNNNWHRDIDNKTHLLKIFFFLTDCNSETGPHEYIRGSCTDPNKLSVLNDKRYYDDDAVNNLYPENGEDRVVSIVPSGTIILEDTRGLHRANILKSGYRDLGYAVFKPWPKKRAVHYSVPNRYFERLTAYQRMFVPDQAIIK